MTIAEVAALLGTDEKYKHATIKLKNGNTITAKKCRFEREDECKSSWHYAMVWVVFHEDADYIEILPRYIQKITVHE
jgi:hypothetical protein